jgi:hypothetical protein
MNGIAYSLNQLRSNAEGNLSKFADSIIDFWRLGPEWRFSVHGYVFKNMDIEELLDRAIAHKRQLQQSDSGVSK